MVEKFQDPIYQGEDGLYYWRLQDGNNRIVATGHQRYTRQSDAEGAFRNARWEMVKSFMREFGED